MSDMLSSLLNISKSPQGRKVDEEKMLGWLY